MKYVLFVCTHNAGRSQMAQAFFEREAPDGVRGEAAGSDPAHALWPSVIEVMREVGIDLSGRRPRKLLLEDQLHAAWAVTMGCGDVCPYVPSTVEAWDIPDPVRSHIGALANRAVSDCLEREHCDALSPRIRA